MTVMQIQKRVARDAKPMTKAGLYKHIRALKLKPLGVSRPANYPDNAADKIIVRLGFVPKNGKTKFPSVPGLVPQVCRPRRRRGVAGAELQPANHHTNGKGRQ